ncbi:hypothetical protein [Niabella beijingensis]|uniref:hypothetical protein n=1 Tax=Niabella beijingensis TaxID=2872700 RepID=UPI001CBAB43F|nr:hypothetical protein [Niabella beijingensis]MBZ4190419.1 hypothetical protein [Niabella beijingensis]
MLFLTGLLPVIVTTAQRPYFTWARSWEGSSGTAFDIATDAAGNVWTTGIFEGTIDGDPGAGTVPLTSNGNLDVYITKLDVNGNLLWSKSFGGPAVEYARSIAIDAAGNVYIAGQFNGTVDFNPGPGTANLTGAGATDVFICKLDANGNYVWAKNMGGTGVEDVYGIALDDSANVYTTGDFALTGDYDPGPGVANLTSAGGTDIFVSKLDFAGNYVWAKSMGGPMSETGEDITTDAAGNVYTTGLFSATADFDPGSGAANLTSAGNSDIFISKLNREGIYIWAKSMGGSSGDNAAAIALDAAGYIYTTGFFSATADFDPGGGAANLTSAGSSDIFISKLNREGIYIWAKSMGGAGTDNAVTLATDLRGNVYTTGRFAGTVDFDPDAGVYNLSSSGVNDIFFSRLNSNGNHMWARSIVTATDNVARGMIIDAAGNLHAAGGFYEPTDFDPGPAELLLTAPTQIPFALKWAQCMSISLPTAYTSVAVPISGTEPILIYDRCQDIATVQPTGTTPVSGNTSAKVWVDAAQPEFVVKRHYEITPANNAAAVTGDITLYFTQQEFADYNAIAASPLPTAADDAAGKANLRILQLGGTSNDNSGQPGSYSGAKTVIDPDDAQIVWNAGQKRWEVTFPVTGFSGFFATDPSTLALPVTFGSISARLKDDRISVNWETLSETNNDHFDIEISVDGSTFKKIGTKASKHAAGNSNGITAYNFSLPLADAMGYLAVSALTLLPVLTRCRNRRKKYVLPAFFATFALLLSIAACKKQAQEVDTENRDLYARIAQVDKDGTAKYSKVMKLKKE